MCGSSSSCNNALQQCWATWTLICSLQPVGCLYLRRQAATNGGLPLKNVAALMPFVDLTAVAVPDDQRSGYSSGQAWQLPCVPIKEEVDWVIEASVILDCAATLWQWDFLRSDAQNTLASIRVHAQDRVLPLLLDTLYDVLENAM